VCPLSTMGGELDRGVAPCRGRRGRARQAAGLREAPEGEHCGCTRVRARVCGRGKGAREMHTPDTPRPSPRTNRTRRVPHPVLKARPKKGTPTRVMRLHLPPRRAQRVRRGAARDGIQAHARGPSAPEHASQSGRAKRGRGLLRLERACHDPAHAPGRAPLACTHPTQHAPGRQHVARRAAAPPRRRARGARAHRLSASGRARRRGLGARCSPPAPAEAPARARA
jgi:hypothetical protein